MKTCIYTKETFQKATGEHILQNFLGARWVSSDISCDKVQEKFGQDIDCALADGLQGIRTLLGTKSGRGGEAPDIKNIEDTKGNKYHLKPGGIPHIAQPIITVIPQEDDSHEVIAKLGDKQQIGWFISKLRTMFPDNKSLIDIDAIKKEILSYPKEKRYLDEALHIQLNFGGKNYFRGLLKSAFNLLGVNNSSIALLPCFDALRTFIVDGVGDINKHIRWLSSSDELPINKMGLFDHFIGIYSHEGNVDGVVQFFGGISHLVRLTDEYNGPDIRYGYQVNPFRDSEPAENRAPVFDPISVSFPKFDDGNKGSAQVQAVYKSIIERLLDRYLKMAKKEEVSKIIDEVLLPHDGEVLSEAILKRLENRLIEFLLR